MYDKSIRQQKQQLLIKWATVAKQVRQGYQTIYNYIRKGSEHSEYCLTQTERDKIVHIVGSKICFNIVK